MRMLRCLRSFRLEECPYHGCLNRAPDLMLVEHLLRRSVPVNCSPCTVNFISSKKTTENMKSFKNILKIASKFPRCLADGSPATDDDAVSWLLNDPSQQLLQQLSNFSNMSTPAENADDVQMYVLSCSTKTAIFSHHVQDVCCHQEGHFVDVFWNRQLARRLQRLVAAATLSSSAS